MFQPSHEEYFLYFIIMCVITSPLMKLHYLRNTSSILLLMAEKAVEWHSLRLLTQ